MAQRNQRAKEQRQAAQHDIAARLRAFAATVGHPESGRTVLSLAAQAGTQRHTLNMALAARQRVAYGKALKAWSTQYHDALRKLEDPATKRWRMPHMEFPGFTTIVQRRLSEPECLVEV